MEDFSFMFPVKVYCGNNSLTNLNILKYKKVLLMYGKNSLKSSGNYDKIVTYLNLYEIEFIDFGGIDKPDYKKVLEAIEICKKEEIEAVIGVGGSTIMDMAKIVSFGALNDNLWDYLSHKEDPTGLDHLFTVEIPTYPAGGSETDSAAEIDDFENNRHGSLYGIYPDVAILCPYLTYSLDIKQTSYSIMEQFVQASCSMLGSVGIGRRIARSVIKNLMYSGDILLKDLNNLEARTNLLINSSINVSGLMSNGGSEIGYSIYSLEGIGESLLNMSYRDALIVYFPLFLKGLYNINKDLVLEYFNDLFKTKNIEDGFKMLYFIYDKYGMPKNYLKFGKCPSNDILNEFCEACDPFSKEEVINIFKSGFNQ